MSARAKKKIQEASELAVDGTAANLGALQYSVLTFVSEAKYIEAVEAMKAYQQSKQYYPGYAKRSAKLYSHGENLITAIKNVKTLPNFATLTSNKQEEILSKAREYWEELRVCLRRLKTIEKDLELEDARSSVWVLKALAISVLVVLFAFVAREAVLSMGLPSKVMLNEIVNLLWERIL